jgi:hypothetical protein
LVRIREADARQVSNLDDLRNSVSVVLDELARDQPDRGRVIAALSVIADTAHSVTGLTQTVEDLVRAVRVSL